MEGDILGLALILGLLFCLLMVFKILPPLDHIVKKNHGPVEACAFTRCCPLVIALPFYVFTIWMTVVIVLKEDKSISVIDQICPDDFGCSNAFALGRAQFDKDVCLYRSLCSDEELQARSGQKPLHFARLGLGEELSPSEFTAEFECVGFANGTCTEVVSAAGSCGCTEGVTSDSFPLDCASDNCLDDIDGNTRFSNCLNDNCTSWSVTTDSAKQFSFQNCYCDDEDCDNFTCDIFVMNYFYPNVFYAGCATILFILPVFVGLYIVIKTHVKKKLACGKNRMYVYNQEAGMQEEYVAENMATGGFEEEQVESSRARKFGLRDVALIFGGLLIILFFSWQVVLVSGRVGLSFIALVPALVLCMEVYQLFKHVKKLKDEEADRIDKNNPDPLRGLF